MTVKPKKLINTFNKIGQGVLHASALLGIIPEYVIEKGEDSNGSWEKYISGKLIFKKKVSYNTPAVSPYGALFYNSSVIEAGSFGNMFVGVPRIVGYNLFTTSRVDQLQPQLRNGTLGINNGGQHYIYCMTNSASNIAGELIIAYEGRWK